MRLTRILRNKWTNKKTYEKTLNSIENALSINPAAYKDLDYFKAEKEKIFTNGWIPIGYTNNFNNDINIVETNIHNTPILLTKNRNEEINGFHNVCRHRGCKLVDNNQTKKVISCPYHKWTYNLDGELKGTPLFESTRDFKKANSLYPINVEINNNIIFGNLDNTVATPPPSISMKSAFKLLSEYNLENCVIVKSKEYHIKANWKLLVDNFIEYYHLPAVHPELVTSSGMDQHVCTQKEGKYISFKTDPISQTDLPIDPSKMKLFSSINRNSKDKEDLTNVAHFKALFPNMFFFLFPNHIFSVIVTPISPTESIEKAVLMVEKNKPIPFNWVNKLFEFYDKVNIEDIEICEEVQKGIMSERYEGGVMVPKYESTIHRYHKMLIEEMTR
jgi:phenylpropionate dioxygenase-like ring-hydroxylating dioxygenase large terminal subunit